MSIIYLELLSLVHILKILGSFQLTQVLWTKYHSLPYLSNAKRPLVVRVFRGIILPSYAAMKIDHYADPY